MHPERSRQRPPGAGQSGQGSAGRPELSAHVAADLTALTGLNHDVTLHTGVLRTTGLPLSSAQPPADRLALEIRFQFPISSTFHRLSLYPWVINFISKIHIVLLLHERA